MPPKNAALQADAPTQRADSQRAAHPPLSPAELAALDLEAHLTDPARKQRFVTPMFEHIAPRYDAFTRLFSFGMDAQWKRTLLAWFDEAAPATGGGHVLDVACGTGDLAFGAAERRRSMSVLGVDAALRMTALASARIAPGDRARVAFATGDLTALALPSASVDIVTGGYALRNVPRYEDGIAELARVLKPGGSLLTLDFYRPAAAWWRVAFLGYLQLTGGIVGWWWHRAPIMYAYIAHSIRHFVSHDDFSRALERQGFEVRRVETHLLGGIALHHAVKR